MTSRQADLIAQAARALHTSGAPSHRLETALEGLAGSLGLQGQFFSTPTSIMMTLRDGDRIETRLERLEPGGLNLERLAELDALVARAAAGADLDALWSELERIETRPPRFGPRVDALGTALVTAAAACVFRGGPADIALAGALGLLVNALTRFVNRGDTSNRLAELAGGLIVAFAASAAAARLPGVSAPVIVIASLIPLLPGLNLTVAIREIAARHLVSGSARFAGTIVVLLTLGAGAALGTRAALLAFGPALPASPGSPAAWLLVPGLIGSAVGLGIIFQARPRDFLPILGAVGIALAGTTLAVPAFGAQAGAAVTSFAVGVFGNLFARAFDRAASVIHVPGLILLVPGAVGFRAFAALSEQDTLAGVQAAFSVLTIGTALAMGLLLASALLPSRRSL